MDKLKEKFYRAEQFLRFEEQINKLKSGEKIFLRGVNGSLLALLLSYIFEKVQRQILIVASDEEAAAKLRDDIVLFISEANVLLFAEHPIPTIQMIDLTSTICQIETLKSLTKSGHSITIATPLSIVEKLPSREEFNHEIFELEVDHEYSFQKFIEHLENTNFERKNIVETYGDFAVRGGIIDVFPYVGENPIRFEFWGDRVESIREFDLISQRSIRELKSASIVPNLLDFGIKNRNKSSASLFNYINEESIVVWDKPEIIQRELEEHAHENNESIFRYEDIIENLEKFPVVVNSLFTDVADSSQVSESDVLDFNSSSQPSFNGSIKLLYDYLVKLSNGGYEIFLTSDTKEESERLEELIEETETTPEEILEKQNFKHHLPKEYSPLTHSRSFNAQFLDETVHSGFIYHPSKIAVFTEHEIFGRLKRRGFSKRKRFKGFTQKEIHQLKRGDYVVHVDHGIGEFVGLTKIKVGGIEQEVMKLQFLDKDTLYVNLNFVNRIQKYSSSEGHVPKLSKLGTPDWERMKSKAKNRIKDIARDLISLYAKRKKEKGFSFLPDSHWQKELEASFIYEDTVDQNTATLDVKKDMESSAPMDRLICGDVGFGKTEVAVRAAFKAVMSGKQVAVLVPTTILAIQHYNTFTDRLHRYTTRVENITRFKSKREQNKILDELKNGSIDIIIGTHRLLSKDIEFKDLGLLIIDEEHRFGVSAKEKLRQLKVNVDTLTLTATPIPRTLHFSLIGARDLSIINTPPRNRLPIITEIIPASDGRKTQWQIIREAILREMHRGGQIYFVHDRVQNIESIAEQVKTHVPEARVHIAHGQMTGNQLEKTMLEFLEKKYDVLVCTKIIESGLDISNVNTIIINRADRFGLAELYQLRGRVGRSNVQAYAYLLVPPLNALPKQTIRRLSAIEEFTELGSGFNLAMRDLEIRGAGNILGAEQSGFIMEMGFEMYEKIVREAVEELKQEEFQDTFRKPDNVSVKETKSDILSVKQETIIDIDIEALIPDFYVESDVERLDIYRRLYNTNREQELIAMREELRDRFGEYPEEVENLFQIIEIRLSASSFGIQKVALKENILSITLPEESNKSFYGEIDDTNSPFQKLMKRIADNRSNDIHLKQIGKDLVLQLQVDMFNKSLERLKIVKQKIEEIALMSALVNE